ncbi:MAG: hypothetical protein AAAB16_00200 [Pseudomonas sp.]|uniref:hypothetical protein n=1 Tax=Pseudomonas sp. TaxID=306 RepID=UPI0030F1F7B9
MDTGSISLWLSLAFIGISLCGLVVIFLIIKNKTIENENIDKIIELGKWFVASVAITLSASIINDGFRERDQDIKEMEVFDKYVSTVLEADSLEKRKLLSEYFVAVSPRGDIRDAWSNYQTILDKHIEENAQDLAKVAQLESKEQKGEATPEELSLKTNLAEKISIRNESLMPVQSAVQRPITRRVYIHINDEAQRQPMKELQNNLSGLGFAVPGIENISGKAQIPDKTNVRYFHDADKEQAVIVAEQLTAAGFADAYPYRVRSTNAPVGSLEVWLSKP